MNCAGISVWTVCRYICLLHLSGISVWPTRGIYSTRFLIFSPNTFNFMLIFSPFFFKSVSILSSPVYPNVLLSFPLFTSLTFFPLHSFFSPFFPFKTQTCCIFTRFVRADFFLPSRFCKFGRI